MTQADNSLTRAERLRSFGAIRRLFKEGRGGFVYPFRYLVYAEPSVVLEPSVLFSTPKKFHKRANRRNLIRRRMREACRLNSSILAQPCKTGRVEIALIYSTKEVLDYNTIENAVKRILEKIADDM